MRPSTSPFHSRPFSRRTLLGAGLGTVGAGVLAACGGSETSPAPAPEEVEGFQVDVPEGPWSFTDDRGVTVDLDATPVRVAGLNDQVAAMWNLGITPVAAFGYNPMADDVNFEDLDIDQVVETGAGYGEIDLEALAAAAPDLIVTTVYAGDESGEITEDALLFGFKDMAQQEKVAAVAPIVAIAMRGSGADVIERNVELVASLGVDTEAGQVATDRAAYEAAGERLAQASRNGVSVMAVAAYPAEGMYVARAEDDPALRLYTELGLTYVDVETDDFYWDVVSWENADLYAPDVVLSSLRAMSIDDLMEQPTFAKLPAAKAGQVYEWRYRSMDYRAQAEYLDQLAGWVQESTTVA